jgi:hypothetical protein
MPIQALVCNKQAADGHRAKECQLTPAESIYKASAGSSPKTSSGGKRFNSIAYWQTLEPASCRSANTVGTSPILMPHIL